jgi:hypothetical protein
MTELNKKSAYSSVLVEEREQRRICPRYPSSAAVEAIDIHANTRIMARLSDISRSGCYIDTINPFAPEASVKLTIVRNNQSFKTRAKVVYSQVGMGMGISFTIAGPEELAKLDAWLEQLSGAKSEESDTPEADVVHQTGQSVDHEVRGIVRQIIFFLSRKGIVNDSEGLALLEKLSK